MAYAYTPGIDADATYLNNGHNLENFSAEQSLLSPIKKKSSDFISQTRSGRGVSLKTPRTRVPLSDRQNLPARGEFTPLLQSVARKNLERNNKLNAAPETPAFLKASYQGSNTPALPRADMSGVYNSDFGSSVIGETEETPVAKIASSSAQSTPLAVLPKDSKGVLIDQGNVLTLKEQENIINKVEKENFGLKLKIHFLEESLRKAGPGFNEAALKENTDLKVDKLTFQRELARCKKQLTQAERDVEAYKLHVQQLQDQAKRKRADESLRQELNDLKKSLAEKEAEIEGLRTELDAAESHGDNLQKLKDDIEDLNVDLREKDRLLEERDDEIDRLKAKESKDDDEFDQVCTQLDAAKERIESLETQCADQDAKSKEMQEELREAKEDKQKAENDLEELQDEMSNKSINTKGLSRQLEEKANRLQNELTGLREKHAHLEEELDAKTREVNRLQEKVDDAEQDADVQSQRLQNENELLQNDHEADLRNCSTLTTQLDQARKDLQSKTEEKDLLHSRHDALTNESRLLQKELSKAQAHLRELEDGLENERQHAQANDRHLRMEAKSEIDRLCEELERMHQEPDNDPQNGLEDKVQALEDEIEVLQNTFDEEAVKAKDQVEAAELEAKSLRNDLAKAQAQLESTQKARDDQVAKEQANFNDRLQLIEKQLEKATTEKQSAQDKLAKINVDLHGLQTSSAEIKAERDEIRSQLIKMQDQVDDTYKLDQEKLDLRKSKLRLENELGRLHEERKGLQERSTAIEHELEQEIERAASVENRLLEEQSELQRQLAAASGSRDRELTSAKQRVERLEARIEELQNVSVHDQGNESAAELSLIQKDLNRAQRKETEYLQREVAQKEVIRELKQRVSNLESQSRELEAARLTADSPKSSTSGSARKSELIELQRQVSDARQQLRDSRAKSKDDLKALQLRLAESERQVQANQDTYEQQREHLEAEISTALQEQEALVAKNTTATQTITRLRSRIAALEKDVQAHRLSVTADNTIAEERKDLHEMLKDAKLTAEDLQVQIDARENQLSASTTREKDLRSQLKRVREERTLQTDCCSALSVELDNLQTRYERAVDNLSRQQTKWEEERKAMASKVRFANTSISELHHGQSQNSDLMKKHASELKGLAKQIQWLRAKCAREEGFRSGLVYEKKFLMMQIQMFETCNSIDLNLLSEMGITPPNTLPTSTRLRLADNLRRNAGKQERKKRPSLRAVGFAILASCRMKKMSEEWAKQKKVREALGRKLEGVVSERMVGKGKRGSR